jgi:hypothetical protein
MDACCVRCFCTGRKRGSVRRSRVVLAPRPWRQAAGKAHAATVARKAAHRGEHEVSRKAIARGKPGCLGCTCQIRVRFCCTFCTRCCGRSRRPAFPAPSVFRRGMKTGKTRTHRAAGTVSHTLRSLIIESGKCGPTVIARLDRATQYSRGVSNQIERPRRTGYPAFAGYDSLASRLVLTALHANVASTLPSPSNSIRT